VESLTVTLSPAMTAEHNAHNQQRYRRRATRQRPIGALPRPSGDVHIDVSSVDFDIVVM
jgi:hypothetical protein